jgi:hypothetical protein
MHRPTYPSNKFDTRFDAMAKAMEEGKMTLQQVIARCQKTGDLTEEQLKRLSDAAPLEVESESDPEPSEPNQVSEF